MMSRFIKTYSRRKGTYGFDLYRVHYPYSNFCVVPWYRSGNETCVCGSGQQFFENMDEVRVFMKSYKVQKLS